MAVWPKAFTRPSLIIFSENNLIGDSDYNPAEDLVTTDHGRSELKVSPERIETSGRMVNGTYRSHFLSEKKEFSWSWSDIPSRSATFWDPAVTADGQEAGDAIIDYLESKKEAFYLKLVYDTMSEFLPSRQPEKVYKVMVKDYSYTIKMRAPNFDMLDIDVTLVEV
jgi:hypothetical protein